MVLASCTVDLVRLRVLRGSDAIGLTSREADVLRFFGRHPSVVVSRDTLLREVWGYSDAVLSRASDNVVRRLREKIERDPKHPDHLLTVHGVGYRFEPLVAAVEPSPPPAAREWVVLGAVRVDLAGRRVVRADAEPLVLAEAEHGVLAALLAADGGVVDRADLQRAVWGRDRRAGRALDGVVRRLRQKLEDDASAPRLVLTARGGGYRLVPPSGAEPSSGLVGRADLLTTLAELRSRWVLLLGPAGIGKSTLARASAPHATWIDLAGAMDPTSAAASAAAALGIELRGSNPVERVGEVLARRGGAMVLDNLEGLGPNAAALVDHWLAVAPGVTLLGTSRTRVGAVGEVVVEVGPLDRDTAIDLFVVRARAASTANRFGDVDRPILGEIVDRLDGNPLAVELAAARTAVLGLADLRARLTVDLLVRTGGTASRHHNLRRLIDDTLAALPVTALMALEQLAPFHGGFTVDDAEGVLGPDAVDHVQVLRDHSLLHRRDDSGGQLRFTTWELVREMLEERDPDPERVRKHCAWLGRWGRPPLDQHLGWVGEEAATARLIVQVDDVVRAARLALRVGAHDLAAACAAGALWARATTGPFAAGITFADEIVAALPAAIPRARVHLRAGEVCNAQGDFVGAEDHYTRGLADLVGRDELVLQGTLEGRLASLAFRMGRVEEGVARNERAVEAARRVGLRDGTLEYREAATARFRNDAEGEEQALARAVVAARASGNRPLQVHAQLFLGIAARDDGRFGEARRVFEGLIALDGPRASRATVLRHLLNTVAAQGDADAVDRWSAVALPLAHALDDARDLCFTLLCRAIGALARDDTDAASRNLDEAEGSFGTSAHFREMVAELGTVRSQIALREGRVDDAIRLGRRAVAAFEAFPRDASEAWAELAMALLASGDVVGARAAFAAVGPEPRACLAVRLCQRAVLAGASGECPRGLSAEARAEATRSERPIGAGDAELVRSLVGAWAVRHVTG